MAGGHTHKIKCALHFLEIGFLWQYWGGGHILLISFSITVHPPALKEQADKIHKDYVFNSKIRKVVHSRFLHCSDSPTGSIIYPHIKDTEEVHYLNT